MISDRMLEFKQMVTLASYHHADDTGQEWGKAREYENRAKEIFQEAPEEIKALFRQMCPGYLIGDWWK